MDIHACHWFNPMEKDRIITKLDALKPCDFCNRTFFPDSLQKHLASCGKPKSSKMNNPRGDWSSLSEGHFDNSVDHPQCTSSMSSMLQLGKERRKRWLTRHTHFQATMRSLRTESSDCSSPTSKSDLIDLSEDLTTCSFCDRSFNELSYRKHAVHCEELHLYSNKNSKTSEAMERFKYRMKYKPTIAIKGGSNTCLESQVTMAGTTTTTGRPSPTLSISIDGDITPTDSRTQSGHWHSQVAASPMVISGELYSPWEVAAQSSNCNQLTTHNVSTSKMKLSSGLQGATDQSDTMADIRRQVQLPFPQQTPVIDILSSPDCSSPSTPSSLSTFSLIATQEGNACLETRATSGFESKTVPNFHCPWSPTVSSFATHTAQVDGSCIAINSSDSNPERLQLESNVDENKLESFDSVHEDKFALRDWRMTPENRLIEICIPSQTNMGPRSAGNLTDISTKSRISNAWNDSKMDGHTHRCHYKRRHHRCSELHTTTNSIRSRMSHQLHNRSTASNQACLGQFYDGNVNQTTLITNRTGGKSLHIPTNDATLTNVTWHNHANSLLRQETNKHLDINVSIQLKSPSSASGENTQLCDVLCDSMPESKILDRNVRLVQELGKSGDILSEVNAIVQSDPEKDEYLFNSPRPHSQAVGMDNTITKRNEVKVEFLSNPQLTNIVPLGEHTSFPESKMDNHPVLQTYLPGIPTTLVLTRAMLHRSPHRTHSQRCSVETGNSRLLIFSPEIEGDTSLADSNPTDSDRRSYPMYCHECGARYAAATAKFCSNCGTSRPIYPMNSQQFNSSAVKTNGMHTGDLTFSAQPHSTLCSFQ